jgi:ABC-type arginine transport system permease subunit
MSLLSAVVAAWLSAYFAVQRVYKEKWWDRKEHAYTEIIRALYDRVRYSELCTEEYLDRNIPKKE